MPQHGGGDAPGNQQLALGDFAGCVSDRLCLPRRTGYLSNRRLLPVMSDWQSWAAPAVVIVTVAILLWRNLRPAKEAGCDEECDCGKGD